jgi:DNA-binding GntR family transcriptional regulator
MNEKLNARDSAYQILKREILSLNLPLGSKINEIELSERLGLSRTPIREALSILETEKLITKIPQVGYFVQQISFRDIKEMFEAREILEVNCTRLALQRGTEEDWQDLEKLITESVNLLKGGDRFQFVSVGVKFHTEIGRITKNELLYQMLKNLHEKFILIGMMIGKNSVRLDAARTDHQIILDGLRSRNPLTVQFVSDHVQSAYNTAVSSLAEGTKLNVQ